MERIGELLARLPRERGQLLPALHLVQEELGWVPREAMRLVARHLRLTEAQVFGPASYYSEFRFSPPPRTLVTWCSGPSCRVLGGERVRRILEAELGCRLGENGPNDGYGLWLGQCNGTCERAPQVWVNGRVVGPLSLAQTVRLARRVRAGEAVAPVAPALAEAVTIQPSLHRREPGAGAGAGAAAASERP